MRIPHNINRNVFNEYVPSKTASNLLNEKNRTILAEDQVWEINQPMRLSELALRVIVANFAENRILTGLPCSERIFFPEILPTDLPLKLVLEHLNDGIYWKRMVTDRWKDRTNHVEDFGFNWKRMYMERHVQELVEGFTPEGFDLDTVQELCELASEYVFKLDLRQLKVTQSLPQEEGDEFTIPQEIYDHIDLSPIITGLKNLVELHIQFGIRHIGSNYKKMLFELSCDDCANIGKGVSRATNLKLLRIHQSAINDEKVIALLSNMISNTTLETLELTNCLIGDDGAIAVAKYLRGRDNLLKLNLCNNKIGEAGMEALAYVLTQKDCSPLTNLNLRFNAFGNDGLRFLASALIRENPKIEVLNLSCCDLNEESGILMAEMLTRNAILTELDLSSNHFGESVGRAMQAAMEKNKTVTFLDLRMTGVSNENLVRIGSNLRFNRIRAKRGEKGVERELHMIEQRIAAENLEKMKAEEADKVKEEAHQQTVELEQQVEKEEEKEND